MMESRCCGTERPHEDPEAAEAPSSASGRRRRLSNATFLLGSAALLAWLGPQWHVSPFLVALGTVLLFAFSAAALFSQAAPAALPRRCALPVLLPCALLLGAAWLPREGPSGTAVVVEVFVPTGLDGKLAGEDAPLQPLPPSIDALATFVAWDLPKRAGRGRLGDLSGLGRPLSLEEVEKLTEPAWFVNGLPLSQLEPLEDAVRREATRANSVPIKVEATRLPAYTGRVPTDLDLRLTGPEAVRCELLVLQEVAGSRPWWKALRILPPTRQSEGQKVADGREYDLTFWVPAVSMPEPLETRLLLVASMDGRFVSTHILEVADEP